MEYAVVGMDLFINKDLETNKNYSLSEASRKTEQSGFTKEQKNLKTSIPVAKKTLKQLYYIGNFQKS